MMFQNTLEEFHFYQWIVNPNQSGGWWLILAYLCAL